jgi:S-DNA-T family DNA segregation ATPase FtsK/SpoIIIE
MEVKAGRNGVLLQPDSLDGETIFKTSLPRTARADFSPGRGYYISRGKFTRIQVPVADVAAVVS